MTAQPRSRRIGSGAALARTVLAFALCASAARAQVECNTVLPGLEPPGSDGTVYAFREYDDGTGPALYAGGSFRIAGDAAASCVARFDGVRWSALGAGISTNGGFVTDPSVADLVVFDFGAGPRLVAGGSFQLAGGQSAQIVAAWDGIGWTAVGALTNFVQALATFDDGGGARLYAAAGPNVLRWNGVAWDVLPSTGGGASDLAVHDDGGGPALYAGGSFGANGGVVRWTGAGWAAFGAPSPAVLTLASYDDGSGRRLHAGRSGNMSPSIVRWSGTSWTAVGTPSSPARALEALDLHDGQGPRLFASLLTAGAPARIVRWSGSAWTDVASGGLVDAHAVTAFGSGASRRLLAGVTIADLTSCAGIGLARAENGAWIPAHPGRGIAHVPPTSPTSFDVTAFAAHDFGAGPEIVVGGRSMCGPPSLVLRPIARWTGNGFADGGAVPWSGGRVHALESVELGGARELFACVDGPGLWRWNGAAWVGLPGDPFRAAYDVQVFSAQGQRRLAVAGSASWAPGIQGALVCTWDGSAWTTIGDANPSSVARALAAFDDGTGPALYCGGAFSSLGGVAGTYAIARWDGVAWSSVGGGLAPGGAIETLAVFDDGSGPALYAGGRFEGIGGAAIADIARWDGVAWTPVGARGTSGGVRHVVALAVHDGGAGARLWAGGDFTAIGGIAASRLARWDGTAWSQAAGAADGTVTALKSLDEQTGSGRTLWAAGEFASIGGVACSRLARIGCATGAGFAFCFGDAAHGPSACPCANPGATGHGCATGVKPAGAILGATGSTAPAAPGGVETLSLVASDLPAATTAVFVQGAVRTAPAPFGEGVLCLGAPLLRLATKHASAGVARYPESGDVPLSVSGGTAFGSGVTRWYQVWFRASATLCGAGNYGTSSGREITW